MLQFILWASCLFFSSLSLAGDAIWLRTTAHFKYKEIKFRPENQLRMTPDQSLKTNVYRLTLQRDLGSLTLLGSLASFNPYKKIPESRVALGVATEALRLIYEQQFEGEAIDARLRLRTKAKLVPHVSAYQELFYRNSERRLSEWRAGFSVTDDFGRTEGIFRVFQSMAPQKVPDQVVMLGFGVSL